jgi:hypothetical protein
MLMRNLTCNGTDRLGVPQHEWACEQVENAFSGRDFIGLPCQSFDAFLRIATYRKVFNQSSPGRMTP